MFADASTSRPEADMSADDAKTPAAQADTPDPEGPDAPVDSKDAEQGPPVLQDWTPLSHCLDYQLGQVAFQSRGAQAFTTNEVPNLINQGGMSAYRAAEVLFANCEEAEQAGALEDEIRCMEIAMGLGLASLQLLDRFKLLCEEAGKDWYGRLTWYATDATPKMITDARDNGVFERHADRVVLARVDAMQPSRLVRLSDGQVVDVGGRLRGIFHSYLLSLLPSNLLRLVETAGADGAIERKWGIVMARTVLRHADQLDKFTHLSMEQLSAVLSGGDFGMAMSIVHLYPLFDLDLSLASLEPDQYEGFAEVERVAEQTIAAASDDNDDKPEPGQSRAIWVLHSSAGQQSARAMLDALRPDGFMLFRDYGPATVASANRSHLYQHYGAATATGLNHFAFDTMYALPVEQGGCGATVSIAETEGEAVIKNRFVARAELPATRKVFLERFDPEAFRSLTARVTAARKGDKKVEEAMDEYREALRIEKDNWALLTEAGEIALRRFRQVPFAAMFARESLRLNPWYNPVAWNVMGDVQWYRGDLDAARQAYERAVRNNPEHWRGWFNLYLLHRERRDYEQALHNAARALAADVGLEEQERLRGAVEDAARLLAEQRKLQHELRKSRQAGSIR